MLSLNSFKPTLGKVKIVLPSEASSGGVPASQSCTAQWIQSNGLVAAVDYITVTAGGIGGVTAVEASRLPESLADVMSDENLKSGWLPYLCTTTTDAPPSSTSASIRLNARSSRSCAPGTGDDESAAAAGFIQLNLLLAALLCVYLVHTLRHAAVRLYVSALHEIGPTPFLLRVGAASVSKPRFLAYIMDASGPFFFVDFLVSNPDDCQMKLTDASLSSACHWLVLSLPYSILVLGATLSGCSRADAFDASSDDGTRETSTLQLFVYYLTIIGQLLGIVYASSWYFDLSWSMQRPLRILAALPWLLATPLALAYLVEVGMCLVLAVLLKPEACAATLILIGTPIVYGVQTLQALVALRKEGAAAMKRARETLSKEALASEEAGVEPLSAGSIALSVVGGITLLIGLVGWALLGMALLTPGRGNPIASLAPTCVTVGAAWQRSKTQIEAKRKQVDEVIAKASKPMSAVLSTV